MTAKYPLKPDDFPVHEDGDKVEQDGEPIADAKDQQLQPILPTDGTRTKHGAKRTIGPPELNLRSAAWWEIPG